LRGVGGHVAPTLSASPRRVRHAQGLRPRPPAPRPAWYATQPSLTARRRWPFCWCMQRGLALTQEPCGITLRSIARREERQPRGRCRPSDPSHRGRPMLVLRGSPERRGEPPQEPVGAAQPPTFRSAAMGRAPSREGRGVTGTSGTGRAQRRRCLPLEPLGGDEVRQGAAAV
jgi:hypothetical protein